MSTRLTAIPPELRFESALRHAFEAALRYLAARDERPVMPVTTPEELRGRLQKPLRSEGLPPEIVIDELARDAAEGLIASAGGSFFAWVMGGTLPAAMAADWLTSAWDQNAGMYACAPAAAIVEEIAGGWLKDLLGLPTTSSFALVTGCQMAHFTCLAAARYALYDDLGYNIEQRGLYGAPPIHLFCSSGRHASIDRAVRLLGMGSVHIHALPVDEGDRLLPEVFADALENHHGTPAIVVLQAGDVNTGACDRFATLIPIARRHGAWVHVDGAFGLWAVASPRYSHLLAGVDTADSWATDGHKWLNVPYDAGYAFVARADAHRAALSLRAPYLLPEAAARDQIDWNPEWSRRARGFATYAAIRQLGRDGVTHLVEGCCEAAAQLVNGLALLNGVQVLAFPTINQGLVRFLLPQPQASLRDHDAYTEAVIARIVRNGKAFFGPTTWRGQRAMRISVCSWLTGAAEIGRAVDAVATAMDEVSASMLSGFAPG